MHKLFSPDLKKRLDKLSKAHYNGRGANSCRYFTLPQARGRPKIDLVQPNFAPACTQGPLASLLHFATGAGAPTAICQAVERSFFGTNRAGVPCLRRWGIIRRRKAMRRRWILPRFSCGSRGSNLGNTHCRLVQLHDAHKICRLSKLSPPPADCVWT